MMGEVRMMMVRLVLLLLLMGILRFHVMLCRPCASPILARRLFRWGKIVAMVSWMIRWPIRRWIGMMWVVAVVGLFHLRMPSLCDCHPGLFRRSIRWWRTVAVVLAGMVLDWLLRVVQMSTARGCVHVSELLRWLLMRSSYTASMSCRLVNVQLMCLVAGIPFRDVKTVWCRWAQRTGNL